MKCNNLRESSGATVILNAYNYQPNLVVLPRQINLYVSWIPDRR